MASDLGMHDKSPEHLLMSESTARQDCRHSSSGLPKGELRLVRANEVSDVGFERLLARPHLALRQENAPTEIVSLVHRS